MGSSATIHTSGWKQALVTLALVRAVQGSSGALHASPLSLSVSEAIAPLTRRFASFAPATTTPSDASTSTGSLDALYQIRGGGKADAPKKKKKRTKKTSTKNSNKDNKKKIIESVLKEKDAAQALGDAIRDRAEQLRKDAPSSLAEQRIEQSIASVGWALGASDQRLVHETALASALATSDYASGGNHQEAAAGGVQVEPSSVLAHYFLKSHGGAHALQCVCSLLAAVAGLGAMLFKSTSPLCLVLMKRCMLFAMVKHVSGLLATTLLTARAIPDVGFRKARIWMTQLAVDPVSQYVFYAACTMLWLPAKQPLVARWWQAYPMVPSILVGPVVLREIISTLLVLSDVLVLWIFGSNSSSATAKDDGNNQGMQQKLLLVSQSVVNAVMSILVTPAVWRSADAAQRQAILAKLTSKVSLALEVLVGILFTVDAALGVTEFSFAAMSNRPSFLELVQRLICTRLYLHFLWTRRRKINRLATSVRGGAAKFPMYLLDVLMDPQTSMGLPKPQQHYSQSQSKPSARLQSKEERKSSNELTWKDYVAVAFGMDNM
jgi:hypothetical protein